MTKIRLNKNDIIKIQQNRDPYLFVDCATEVIPGKSSKGYKDLKFDEWFFKVHWEKDPNMPGMLQIEALVQTCALALFSLPGNKDKVAYLVSANNIKLIKRIVPECRLIMETEVISYKRGIAVCSGKGIVDDKIVCKANFNLILPNELKNYTLKN